MQSQDIVVVCDVYCKWRDSAPTYRCWVNHELFAERTWIWRDVYLEEQLSIRAEPGNYVVRFELVNSHSAAIKIRNMRVTAGPGRVIADNCVEIYHEA